MHQDKCKVWARENFKTDFSKVVFNENIKVMLDELDGWSEGWFLQDRENPVIVR